MAKRPTAPARPKLEPLLVLWQARLRLLDWQITIEYVSPDAPEFDGLRGQVSVNLAEREAHIRILDPKLGPNTIPEATLVHELAHIHFYPMTKHYAKDSVEEMFEEQAIAAFTSALMGAYGKN